MNAEREAFERTVRLANNGARIPVSLKPPKRRSRPPRQRIRFKPWVVVTLFFLGYILSSLLRPSFH